MKVFKSKIGYGILIPILLLLFGIASIPVLAGAPVKVLFTMSVIMIPIIAFTFHIFFSTSYSITSNNQLLIKCGFLYRKLVDIDSIKSIEKTTSALASPAASMDRIELKFGKWDSVIVSPEDKQEFVQALLDINPSIEHKLE